MAVRKKPAIHTVVFAMLLFSAFLASGDPVTSEGSIKSRRAGRGSNLQMDMATPVATGDGSDHPTLSGQSHGILFEPPVLDFREWSVGMPKMETVHISNPSHSQPLHLNSISGDSPVFHASFFKSKVLKAGESTTFDVIFLARVVESVHTSLYIQTSLGTFDYKVQGVGVPNKFRLRSLLGARIPMNATYSPLISMYNPYNSSMQVTEMYSSGGDLHLELLTGQPLGSRSLWEIRPYETKTIGRANFFGRVATNHTSFIRIKTTHVSNPSIVLPVEVEVLESASLFLSREILDFGILKSGESKSLPLYVLNSGSNQVHIKSITIEPENRAIEVEYTSIILKPSSKYAKIAMVTFYSDRVSLIKQSSGVLIIQADGRAAYQLEVPFEANVLHGSLSYEKSKTLFKVGHPPFQPVVHEIPLANRFKVPVVLYDVKLPSRAQEFFAVSSFTGPYILPPDSEWHYPFSIQFFPSSSDCLFNTTLRLSTNSTYFNIPIHCYDGRVKYSVEGTADEDTLDYGVLSETSSVSKMVTLHNVNPVEIQILSFAVSPGLTSTTMELLSIHPTPRSPLALSVPPPKAPHLVEVGHSATFRVNVTKPRSGGRFSGEVLIHTSFDNTLRVPVYYKAVIGELKISPEFINFEPIFPYGVTEVPLYLENLYHQPVTVTSVQRDSGDSRFYFRAAFEASDSLLLKSKDVVQIGTAVFDPLLEAGSESVYLGVGNSGSWSRSMAVGGTQQSDPLEDLKHFSYLWKAWNLLTEEGMNVLNFSYVVTSDIGSELSVRGNAMLVWPHVLETIEDNMIEFPTTTIGSSYLQLVNVTNPSNQPLMIQPVLLQHYSRSQSVVDLLSEQFNPDLQNVDFNHALPSSFSFSREHVEFDTDSSLASTTVHPHHPHQITVAFSPKMDAVSNTLLLIRNNLTVLDYVLLRGRGVQGVFSINGIQPSSDPLSFEFTQTMMEQCQAGPLHEPMKVNRVFTMQNSGAVPLTLYLIGVGAGGREEGGFKVCGHKREIIIKPNKTESIEISFVPDFTLSRVSNTLRFKTASGTELLFPLLAILPQNLLAVCYAMQPRPEWEGTIAWISVPFWICVLLAMIVIILLQTSFGSSSGISYHYDNAVPLAPPTGGRVFDLKSITSSNKPDEAILDSSRNTTTSRVKPPEVLKHREAMATLTPPSSKDTQREIHTSPSSQTSSSMANLETKLRNHPPFSQSETHDLIKDLSSVERKSEEFTLASKQSLRHSSLVFPPVQGNHPHGTFPNVYVISKSLTPHHHNRNTSAPPERIIDSTTGIKEVRSMVTRSVSGSNLVLALSKSEPEKPVEMASIEPLVSSEFQSTPPQAPIIQSTSPTTGASITPSLPPPIVSSKKLKGSRKSNYKIQKQPFDAASSQSVSHVPVLKGDHLERKGSESSLKSTDSESTTSSGDKYDDKDFPDSVSAIKSESDDVTGSVPQNLTLAKEPNTGQTMPFSESPDDPEVTLNEETGKKESGSSKAKSKKKLRQQRKEEKLKRKEREKERVLRGREKVTVKPQDPNIEVSSYLPEQLEDDVIEDILETKDGKPKPLYTILRHEPTLKKKPIKYVQPGNPGAYVAEEGDILPGTIDDIGIEEDEILSQYSPLPVPSSAVPSSAFKNFRGTSSKPQYEDIISDPFSRNPDRSTYASKKTSSRKPSDKGGTVAAEDNNSVVSSDKHHGKEAQKSLEGSDESISEEYDSNNVSPEDFSELDTQGSDSNGSKPKSPQGGHNPTSPHDLAASLLSKIPIKRKKSRSDQMDSLDYEEDDMKQENFKVDEVEMINQASLHSPSKDSSSSLSSPSDQHRSSSTLSLHAEPFYPSSKLKSKKHSKSDHKSNGLKLDWDRAKSVDRKSKSRDPRIKDIAMADGRHSSKLAGHPNSIPPNNGIPYMGPQTEKAMMERAEYFRQHSEKSSTPSPPFSGSFGDPQGIGSSDQPYDTMEPVSAFRRPQERNLQGTYYPGMDESLFHDKVHRDPLDTPYIVPKTRRTSATISSSHKMTNAQYQQQMPSGYPQAQPLPGYGSRDSAGMRSQQFENDFKRQQFLRKRKLILDLYRQEHAVLAASYAREQARKSAEALNSLHRPSRMGMFVQEPAKRHPSIAMSPTSLWDDYSSEYSPPTQRHLKDPEVVSPHLSSNSYAPGLGPGPHNPMRGRTTSETSDIGGEILHSYQAGVPTPASMGPPGYKRAPGAEYSGLEQQDHDDSEGNAFPVEHQQRIKNLAWPSDMEDPSVAGNAAWSNSDNNSWMVNSPFNTNPEAITTGDNSRQTSSNQPFSNTYELFENQSIWSLNNSGSESSNLLSWALLGAEQQDDKLPD